MVPQDELQLNAQNLTSTWKETGTAAPRLPRRPLAPSVSSVGKRANIVHNQHGTIAHQTTGECRKLAQSAPADMANAVVDITLMKTFVSGSGWLRCS